MLCPIIICSAIFFCPESPRWYVLTVSRPNLCHLLETRSIRYVSKGKIEQARRTLHLVRETGEEVETELLEIREAIEYEQREYVSRIPDSLFNL